MAINVVGIAQTKAFMLDLAAPAVAADAPAATSGDETERSIDCLLTVAPPSFNGGFEQAVTGVDGTAVPAQWSMDGDAAFAADPELRRQGTSSARVTLRRPNGTASLSIVPPDALVRPGTRVVAHAWADSSSATTSARRTRRGVSCPCSRLRRGRPRTARSVST